MQKLLKNLITLCLIGMSGYTTQAQEVVASSGGHGTSQSAQLSWTLGEGVIETFTGTNSILTQGFHQTKMWITSIDEIPDREINIHAYPNPATDYLKIKFEETDIPDYNNLKYKLFDIHGRLLMDKKLTGPLTTVNFHSHTPGNYILKVCKKNDVLKVFKIFKIK